ncbi:MAG: B12-binding domain-containing radical SAM protein [Candidatus Omnitrophica bacterium]|nr:B12-binding domain-containing radical SAM protein [Candidatus Omnitrophota bacterium]
MKVILIQPNSMTSRGILTLPLALLSVGEAARQKGHEVKILDRNVDCFTKDAIKKFKPDVVGFSVFTGPLIKDAILISRFVKKELGNKVKVVWGGIHPSLLPEETVSNDFVDIAVIGEGEATFAELLDSLENRKPLQQVKGICYKENNGILKTAGREFADLDALPFINWGLIDAKRYLDLEIVLVTSRGCPYNCYFCYNMEFNGRRWRAQSAERVLEEIRRVERKTRNRFLKFHDDNFTVDKERTIRILEGLSSDYSLYIESRPERIDKEFLEALKRFNKVWLFIGVESGSEALLKSMNKMVAIDTIRNAFRLIRHYNNILTTASVILGLPGETYEDSLKTIRFAKSLNPSWITYCLFTPYPGSHYYNDLVKRNMLRAPSETAEWAGYTPDIGKIDFKSGNLSKLYRLELKKINLQSWAQAFFNVVIRGDIRKLYRFFKDKLIRAPLMFCHALNMD